nr:MAG TPA: hypothetical protein [Caudoviricetes sp.]
MSNSWLEEHLRDNLEGSLIPEALSSKCSDGQ